MTICTWAWQAKSYTESFVNEWYRHAGIFDKLEHMPDGVYELGSMAAIDLASTKNMLRLLADRLEAEEKRLVKCVSKAA